MVDSRSHHGLLLVAPTAPACARLGSGTPTMSGSAAACTSWARRRTPCSSVHGSAGSLAHASMTIRVSQCWCWWPSWYIADPFALFAIDGCIGGRVRSSSSQERCTCPPRKSDVGRRPRTSAASAIFAPAALAAVLNGANSPPASQRPRPYCPALDRRAVRNPRLSSGTQWS